MMTVGDYITVRNLTALAVILAAGRYLCSAGSKPPQSDFARLSA
jgi:hypothetical protein